VLEKLRGLDPKSFGVLSGMLSQAQGHGVKGESFLQYLREDPEEAAEKLERLAPVLEKLRSLDPRSFGALNGLVSQAQAQAGKASAPSILAPGTPAALIQRGVNSPDDLEAERRLEALQPVLNKLKGLDSKAFGMLSNMMAQATGQHS